MSCKFCANINDFISSVCVCVFMHMCAWSFRPYDVARQCCIVIKYTVHTISTFETTFTAGLCMHVCLPKRKETILTEGTHKDISYNSSKFRPESWFDIEQSCNPLT